MQFYPIVEPIRSYETSDMRVLRATLSSEFISLDSSVLFILSEQQSSLTPVDIINHLQIHNIEINYIGNDQIDAHYLLIEGKFSRIDI